MEHDYLIQTELPPRVTDAIVSMRVPSFVVFLASVWFTGTPIAYYGMSQNVGASFNFFAVGGVLLLASALRLWYPLETVGFSWLNAILGIWAFISPWVFGFSNYTSALINTLCLGVVITAMSIISARAKRLPGTPLATAYEDRQGLEEQDYDYFGSNQY